MNVVSPGIIQIVDQDPGITLALREQVFERFWRGREQHRTDAGLGLAIARDIMRPPRYSKNRGQCRGQRHIHP